MSMIKLFQKAEAAYRKGQYRDALKTLKKLEKSLPGEPEVAHLRGVCFYELQDYANAERALTKALAAKPNDRALINALATTYKNLEKFVEAEALFLKLLPGATDWNVFNNFGNLLKATGRLDDAIAVFERGLEIKPDAQSIWQNLAPALRDAGRGDDSLLALQRAAELAPDEVRPWSVLGHEAMIFGNHDVALAALEKALALDPDDPTALLAMGFLEIELCDSQSGAEKVRRACRGDLHPSQLSGAVFALSRDESTSAEDILRLAKSWHRRYPTPPSVTRGTPAPTDGRPLRIGIVAGHFHQHPVSFFLKPWLRAAPAAGLEVVIFYVRAVDEAAKADWAGVHAWVDLRMNSPRAAAERVAAEQIDILVSAAGHADDSRLDIFPYRPAPVQAVGFAYFCTTGIKEIDYAIADDLQCPPEHEGMFAEKVIRLPNNHACFDAPKYLPAIAPPPAGDGLVIGSFNAPNKYGPKTAGLWASVLEAVPEARLLLKGQAFKTPTAVDNVRQLFSAAGVAPERLIIEGPASRHDLLQSYNRLSIALDPLGYSGGVTTLEALWMGVPVVTLPGEKYSARHSLAHLRSCGLDQFIAADAAAYIEIVRNWLSDPGDLVQRKTGIREAIRTSPVSDGDAYARVLADALRKITAAR